MVVALITRTVRGIANEFVLNADDGLPHPSAASFDNLRVILKSHLTERISALPHCRSAFCAALAALADC